MGSTARSHTFYLTDLLGFNVSRGSAVELTNASSIWFTISGSITLFN
jgi:hypothetical protein